MTPEERALSAIKDWGRSLRGATMTPEERAQQAFNYWWNSVRLRDEDQARRTLCEAIAVQIREAENERTRECFALAVRGDAIHSSRKGAGRIRERWPEAFDENQP